MALDKRIMALVEQAQLNGEEINEALKARRARRNNAIRNYQSDEHDDIETGDIAREEMAFIQRVEAYTGKDVSRFAAMIAAYLAGAPARDQKRIADNLFQLHEAVANGVLSREVRDDLPGRR